MIASPYAIHTVTEFHEVWLRHQEHIYVTVVLSSHILVVFSSHDPLFPHTSWPYVPSPIEVSGQRHILSYDLTMTSCFSFCELRNVDSVGFTDPGVPGVIISALCVHQRLARGLKVSQKVKPRQGTKTEFGPHARSLEMSKRLHFHGWPEGQSGQLQRARSDSSRVR